MLALLALVAVCGATRVARQRGGAQAARPRAASRSSASPGTPCCSFGLVVCVLGHGLRPGDLHAAQEPAGAPLDARDLGADLRDLQDLPDHPGQVHPDPLGCSSPRSSSSTSASCGTSRCDQRAHHPRSSAWSASPAATAWPGSASGSTPSPTRARPSPACGGKPFPTYAIPLKAGMSIGMLLISIELLIMLGILLFVPGDYAGPCFIGFAIGESLGAAALRIAGGIFTKIADIGSDLMKIVFNIKEDDARNPGVIADCTGDNAGDSVGPTADGFETYGVTGVALITFILLAVAEPDRPGPAPGLDLRHARHDDRHQRSSPTGSTRPSPSAKYEHADKMNFEHPLTSLVWLTSIVSVGVTYVVSYAADPRPRRRHAVVEARHDHHLRHARRRDHPRAGQGLHLDRVAATCRRSSPPRARAAPRSTSSPASSPATSAPTGWASRSSRLMAIAYWVVAPTGLGGLMLAPAVFAFGLVAFGFLGMGPVTIAVDSYGPVTDNAQSVYELSLIETHPEHQGGDQEGLRLQARLREGQGLPRGERRRRQHLQGHRQAGADRHRGGRRHDADLLDHRDADQRA